MLHLKKITLVTSKSLETKFQIKSPLQMKYDYKIIVSNANNVGCWHFSMLHSLIAWKWNTWTRAQSYSTKANNNHRCLNFWDLSLIPKGTFFSSSFACVLLRSRYSSSIEIAMLMGASWMSALFVFVNRIILIIINWKFMFGCMILYFFCHWQTTSMPIIIIIDTK